MENKTSLSNLGEVISIRGSVVDIRFDAYLSTIHSVGAAGIIAAFEGRVEHIMPPTVSVVSKVGAGDSMVAGIVLSLAKGMLVYEAVRFGVAAGTAAVMTPGTELCRREDTERLYGEMTNGQN